MCIAEPAAGSGSWRWSKSRSRSGLPCDVNRRINPAGLRERCPRAGWCGSLPAPPLDQRCNLAVAGSSFFLTRLVGYSRALEIPLEGARPQLSIRMPTHAMCIQVSLCPPHVAWNSDLPTRYLDFLLQRASFSWGCRLQSLPVRSQSLTMLALSLHRYACTFLRLIRTRRST